jgi:FtsZ-binding cell division protein ZapB
MECRWGADCPYVNGGDIRRLIAERDYLSQRLDEMQGVMTAAEAKIENLRQENEKLTEENKRLTEANKNLSYQLKQMLGKIFKPQVKPVPDVDRPRRGAPRGHRGNSRRRPEEISEFVDIYPNKCDKCGGTIQTNYEAVLVQTKGFAPSFQRVKKALIAPIR